MSFNQFAQTVTAAFNRLNTLSDLLVISAPGDELYTAYLAAFPEGTNLLVKERTEHDCTNCKGFIRNFGGVVHVNPDTLAVSTVWDGEFPAPYDVVASRLRAFVGSQVSYGLFRSAQPTYSVPRTVTLKADTGRTVSFDHLHGKAAGRFVSQDGAQAGAYLTALDMLRTAFRTLNPGALAAVTDLIQEGHLYRGEEMLSKVQAFQVAMTRYHALNGQQRRLFVAVTALDAGVARFKNSVIGTLVADLADGEDTEAAVRSYERKVAPENYQRTSQLITQKMVDEGLKKLSDLGLDPARRMATLADVSVNNVQWVDNSGRKMMKHGLAAVLGEAVTAKPVTVAEKSVTDVSIDAFLQDVLPGAQTLRMLVTPELSGNFMTLTTALNEEAARLFRWDNPFAWSYAGGAADMIQQRVKAAGGNIHALLRFSLSWYNTDDLDVHCRYDGPDGETATMYFGSKNSRLRGLSGGLDVDMNVHGETRTPVENIAFTRLLPGRYTVSVHNYTRREHTDVGFTLQVASEQGVTDYHHTEAVGSKQVICCLSATVDLQGNVSFDVSSVLKTTAEVGGKKWELTYGQYADVRCVLQSPNHWDGQANGNRHTFFILKDAKTDERPRGFYNEYLRSEVLAHRKVMDVIAERTRPELQDEQLSGIGVSSTLKKAVVVEVSNGSSRRAYRVQF